MLFSDFWCCFLGEMCCHSFFFFFFLMCIKECFFLPLALKIFLFNHWFNATVLWCLLACISTNCGSFGVLNMWLYSFIRFGKFGQSLSKYLYLFHSFSLIFLGLKLYVSECLMCSYSSLPRCFFFKNSFSLCISFWIVSTAMSSRSLTFSSTMSFLPLNPSNTYFLSYKV